MFQIVSLLTKDFLKQITIALIIALPLSFFMMHTWLQEFAYRIEISVWLVITSAVVITIVTLITMSYKSISAAIINPVKSLKTE